MPFIPHTPDDERRMLEAIGVSCVEDLFDEIPSGLRAGELNRIPAGISEMNLMKLMGGRARQDRIDLSFLGAGAYEHHIPAAVWDLVGRGEFMTAYTPYQAEASQGTLQVIYEFQTMITRLLAMDVANASVYDGATALAEAVLMAVRANRKNSSRRVIVAGNTHPNYLRVCHTLVRNQGIELLVAPYDRKTGQVSLPAAEACALVVSYPSFFGGLDDVDLMTDWAHDRDSLVIGVVNPTAMAVLKAPGNWGERGADIAVGEGQPLGIPLASGGPYLGFMCCRKNMVRQMPGRIVGRTLDMEGRVGFVLTLQAREQHIRRGKATSNICTNQGLLVTAAAMYLSLLGDRGLRSVALRSAAGLDKLVCELATIEGVREKFSAPRFHEAVMELPCPAKEVAKAMADRGILAGYDLGLHYAELRNCLLINVTETKSDEDLARYFAALADVLGACGC